MAGLSDFLGQPLGDFVIYYPRLGVVLRSVTAAILLQKLVFWQFIPLPGDPRLAERKMLSKEEAASRWVWKTLPALAKELGFGVDELKGARQRLEEARLIRTEYKRLEHQLYFQVNFAAVDALGEKLSDCFNAKVESPASGKGQNAVGDVGKPLLATQENKSSIYKQDSEGDVLGVVVQDCPSEWKQDLAELTQMLAREGGIEGTIEAFQQGVLRNWLAQGKPSLPEILKQKRRSAKAEEKRIQKLTCTDSAHPPTKEFSEKGEAIIKTLRQGRQKFRRVSSE